MGMIGKLLGANGGGAKALGEAVTGVAEVFLPNATRAMENAQGAYIAALAEHGEEFRTPPQGWFDQLVNGLNRMPRPMLALGTLGLFVYGMVDPEGFARRMVGLDHVPEPLWWLLAAIVSFYFGAREAHYFRSRKAPEAAPRTRLQRGGQSGPNAALDEMRQSRG